MISLFSKMRISTKLFIAMSLVILAAVAMCTAIIYHIQEKALMAEIDARLMTAAKTIKYIIGRDYHDKIEDQKSVSKQEFLDTLRTLDAVCVDLGLRYLWTVMIYDGKVVFTSATSTNKRQIKHAWFFDVHRDPKVYAVAFETMQPSFSHTKNEWGQTRALLIPDYDAKGRKFIFAASIQVTEIQRQLDDIIYMSAFISLSILAALLIASYLLSRTFTKPISRIAREAQAVATGDLERSITAHGSQETLALASSIDSMRVALLAKITQLNSANRELLRQIEDRRVAEKKYRTLVDTMPDGMLVINVKGILTYANPSFCRMLGYEPEETLGRHYSHFLSEEDQKFMDAQIELRKRGLEDSYEINWIAKDGSVRTVKMSPKLLTGDRGGHRGSLAIVTDITESKQAQTEKQKLEDRLLQAQKMEAIGTLAGGIAHDFNNILGAIVGYTELTLDEVGGQSPVRANLNKVLTAAERAGGLVKQILAFSRKRQSLLQPVNLNLQVAEAVKILESTLPKMIEIKLDLANDLRPILGDTVQLEQIIMNLGANAGDAMTGGGELRIETSNVVLDQDYHANNPSVTPGQYVLLQVTDSGHGMDTETLRQIFDPFFTTKGIGKGTGLGLSTVFGIVKSHQSHITCYSEPERGTTFRIYFPALEGDWETVDEASSGVIIGGNEKILLVDDEEALRKVGKAFLRSKGYQVLTASRGEEALDIYFRQGSDVDLVLLDVSMPGMGGYQCLQELRILDPGVKVIIASGYAQDGQMQKNLDSGAAAYIAKPFTRTELLRLVRQVLDREDSS